MKVKSGSLLLMLGWGWMAGAAVAGVATDGSLGSRQTLAGPNFVIPDSLGARQGNNLFHSFEHFSVQSGQSATFTGPADIAHVVSRVTGGEATEINGLLRSTIGQADFYLINPAGMLFGPQAKVDVPAAFHASTAQALRMADGSQWDAGQPVASSLSYAAPTDFGFGPHSANLSLQGAQLQLKPEASHSFSAGSLDLTDSQITAVGGGLTLRAAAGGAIALSNTQISVASGTLHLDAASSLALRQGTQLHADTTSSVPAGRIQVQAGSMLIDQGTATQPTGIFANASPGSRGTAGTIEIAAQMLELLGVSLIDANTQGAGTGGSIHLGVGQLRIDGQGRMLTWQGQDYKAGIDAEAQSTATGAAGRIEARIDDTLQIRNTGALSTSSLGTGDAGTIQISARQILLDGAGLQDNPGILSVTTQTASNRAGTITLTTSGQIVLTDGAWISNFSSSNLAGGHLTIDAGALSLTGIGSWIFSSTMHAGDAGSMQVRLNGDLALIAGGQIFANTSGAGRAGNISIRAHDLLIDQQGLNDRITGIRSAATRDATGDAGTIDIQLAGQLSVQRGGQMTTNTSGPGNAGAIHLRAAALSLSGGQGVFASISSDATGAATGHAGAIEAQVSGPVTITRGGALTSSTSAVGDAGSIHLVAHSLTIDDDNTPGVFTGIASQSNPSAQGHAGQIDLEIRDALNLLRGGQISSSTLSDGNAGNIHILAGQLKADAQQNYQQIDAITGITSITEGGLGNAGAITIAVREGLELVDGGRISSSTQSRGNAGVIEVTAGDLRIQGRTAVTQKFSGITSSANPGSRGQAGNVRLQVAGDLEIVEGGQISTSTYAQGQAGDLAIQASRVRIDGSSVLTTGIFSQSDIVSTGPTGSIALQVDTLTLDDHARIGIASNRQISGAVAAVPAQLIISARDVELHGESRISAESTSNDPAARIDIHASRALIHDGGSLIATRSNQADAGPIHLQARTLLLNNAQVTTSVGEKDGIPVAIFGNGGDIAIDTQVMLMDTGFVQANTQGLAGKGGAIVIPGGEIVVPWNSLDVGGGEAVRFVAGSGRNVIQAAAREGIPGDIQVTAPVMDVTSTLLSPDARYRDFAVLGGDPCSIGASQTPSSLVKMGRGLMPATGAGEINLTIGR